MSALMTASSTVVRRPKCIYNFWCSMLVYAPFALCFVYTLWCFYVFSGTNLLTRCHGASSLFSAIFVFQQSYTGNILRIGWNKSWSSYFSWHETESKAETEEGCCLLRYDCCESPSSWEPQEEGMMNIAARFSLSKKPRFIDPKGKKPND
jgi:hypothetical protein